MDSVAQNRATRHVSVVSFPSLTQRDSGRSTEDLLMTPMDRSIPSNAKPAITMSKEQNLKSKQTHTSIKIPTGNGALRSLAYVVILVMLIGLILFLKFHVIYLESFGMTLPAQRMQVIIIVALSCQVLYELPRKHALGLALDLLSKSEDSNSVEQKTMLVGLANFGIVWKHKRLGFVLLLLALGEVASITALLPNDVPRKFEILKTLFITNECL